MRAAAQPETGQRCRTHHKMYLFFVKWVVLKYLLVLYMYAVNNNFIQLHFGEFFIMYFFYETKKICILFLSGLHLKETLKIQFSRSVIISCSISVSLPFLSALSMAISCRFLSQTTV